MASREVWSALDGDCPIGVPDERRRNVRSDSAAHRGHGPGRRRGERVTEGTRIPLPALVFIAAAVAVEIAPVVHAPDHRTVNRVVTVALVCVFFDGGMPIGWSRFRTALAPTAIVGGSPPS